MHCCRVKLLKAHYDLNNDIIFPDTQERYNPLDEHQKEGRRLGVVWERIENSASCIPVFVKIQKDKERIENAIKRDDFISKVIVGKRLKKVIDAMYLRDVKEKEEIIREGDVGKHMYIVAEGKFEVSKEDKGVVTTLYSGKVFGELALLYNAKRQATVTSLTTGKVWVLDRDIYQTIVKKFNIEEKAEKLAFLQECDKLNQAPQDVLAKAAELLQKEYFTTGKVIVREGDAADKFYIITAGSVAIMKIEEGFKGYLHKGNCFGERAIISEGPRQATVIAGDAGVECLTLARQHFINHFGNIQDITKISIPQIPQTEMTKKNHKDKHRQFKLSDFRILNTIGEGGFGRVELIQHRKKSSTLFALKVLKRAEMVKQKQFTHIKNEKNILMSCESPFIVKLYKTEKDKKYLYFWLEWCIGGEVLNWIQNSRNKRLEEQTAIFVSGCLLEALDYLHERKIIYRDIKPENLLVDHRGYVKLADFGFAKKLELSGRACTFAGTPEYVAPEILASLDYDRAVDFWAFGVLIFELLNGRSPFYSAEYDNLQIYRNIERGFEKVPIPSHFSEEAVHLLKALLRHIPEERLGYQLGGHEKIRSHQWYSSLDWKLLKECQIPSPIKPILGSSVDLRYMNIIQRKHSIPQEDRTKMFDDF